MVLEHFLYSDHDEVASVGHRFDEVVKAAVLDPENNSYRELVSSLLSAYWDAVRLLEETEGSGAAVESLTGQAAETFLSDLCYGKSGHDPSSCVFSWPESMSYLAQWPTNMLTTIGNCLVEKEAALRRAIRRHFLAERRRSESPVSTTHSVKKRQ